MEVKINSNYRILYNLINNDKVYFFTLVCPAGEVKHVNSKKCVLTKIK